MIRHRHRHRPTDRDLVALADGSLPPARRARVEQAVAASPELQASLARQRRALAAVRATSPPAPAGLRARLALERAPTRRSRRPRALALAATAALAVALAVALTIGGGGPQAPTAAEAAVLAARPALAPATAPAPGRARATLPGLTAAGLPYPYWQDEFGWRAVGVRRDRLGGRPATTVFYRRAGRRIGYTIVGGPPLAVGASARRTVIGGTAVRSFSARGRQVVTWLRRGHTCVLSGPAVPAVALRRLAAWKGGGALPY